MSRRRSLDGDEPTELDQNFGRIAHALPIPDGVRPKAVNLSRADRWAGSSRAGASCSASVPAGVNSCGFCGGRPTTFQRALPLAVRAGFFGCDRRDHRRGADVVGVDIVGPGAIDLSNLKVSPPKLIADLEPVRRRHAPPARCWRNHQVLWPNRSLCLDLRWGHS